MIYPIKTLIIGFLIITVIIVLLMFGCGWASRDE